MYTPGFHPVAHVEDLPQEFIENLVSGDGYMRWGDNEPFRWDRAQSNQITLADLRAMSIVSETN